MLKNYVMLKYLSVIIGTYNYNLSYEIKSNVANKSLEIKTRRCFAELL